MLVSSNQLHAEEHGTSQTDLWRVLARRKMPVLAMPVLSLLVATGYLLNCAPIFESRAVVQIGQIGQVGQVETPSALVRRLKEQYRVDDKEAADEVPRVADITLDNKNASNIVILKLHDRSAAGAQKHLDEVVKGLLAEHSRLYDQTMNFQSMRLRSLSMQMQNLNDHIVKLSSLTDAVRGQNPAQAAIIAIEKGKLLADAPGLESQYTALQLAMSDIQSQPTRVLREPSLQERQIKPRSGVVLALAFLFGVFLGLVTALTVDSLASKRSRLRA